MSPFKAMECVSTGNYPTHGPLCLIFSVSLCTRVDVASKTRKKNLEWISDKNCHYSDVLARRIRNFKSRNYNWEWLSPKDRCKMWPQVFPQCLEKAYRWCSAAAKMCWGCTVFRYSKLNQTLSQSMYEAKERKKIKRGRKEAKQTEAFLYLVQKDCVS